LFGSDVESSVCTCVRCVCQVLERKDEEEACMAVAAMEVEVSGMQDYIAELEAENEQLRQQASIAQPHSTEPGEEGAETQDSDSQTAREGMGALQQRCEQQEAQLEALARDNAALEQALAAAQHSAEMGSDAGEEPDQAAPLAAQLQEAEALIQSQARNLHATAIASPFRHACTC
jgi:hypothetical protein